MHERKRIKETEEWEMKNKVKVKWKQIYVIIENYCYLYKPKETKRVAIVCYLFFQLFIYNYVINVAVQNFVPSLDHVLYVNSNPMVFRCNWGT